MVVELCELRKNLSIASQVVNHGLENLAISVEINDSILLLDFSKTFTKQALKPGAIDFCKIFLSCLHHGTARVDHHEIIFPLIDPLDGISFFLPFDFLFNQILLTFQESTLHHLEVVLEVLVGLLYIL